MCTPYAGAAGMLLHINGKRENLNNLFCRKVSFLTAPHCQFRGVCQGMKAYISVSVESIYFMLNGIDAINEIFCKKTSSI